MSEMATFAYVMLCLRGIPKMPVVRAAACVSVREGRLAMIAAAQYLVSLMVRRELVCWHEDVQPLKGQGQHCTDQARASELAHALSYVDASERSTISSPEKGERNSNDGGAGNKES